MKLSYKIAPGAWAVSGRTIWTTESWATPPTSISGQPSCIIANVAMNAAADKAMALAHAELFARSPELLRLAERLAYPDAGELLTLEDYRNMARVMLEQPSEAAS